jgi:hypothetical protein
MELSGVSDKGRKRRGLLLGLLLLMIGGEEKAGLATRNFVEHLRKV